jgi:hypothetical protein
MLNLPSTLSKKHGPALSMTLGVNFHTGAAETLPLYLFLKVLLKLN